MIDLYTWATPNGRKVSIALEELGLDYRVRPVNIGAGEQMLPGFLARSPNGKIPVIVDHDTGQTLIESGAILLYLADKARALGGADTDVGPRAAAGQEQQSRRWLVLQWLMLQMAAVGPVFGQTHHFHKFNPGIAPYAEDRFLKETHRLYAVLDKRLAEVPFLAVEYSIADIATFPWVARWPWHSVDWAMFPNLARWFRVIAQRQAVQRGYNVPASDQRIELPDA